MFREVRRNKKQVLSKDRAIAILERGASGVLSLIGDDGYAYGVPMSYVYEEGRLYFHSAVRGHKIDAINNHSKVSFAVIETDHVVPSEFTTYYKSVIAFGIIRFAGDDAEKRKALDLLIAKYAPGYLTEGVKEIEGSFDRVQILVLDIEHMSGKEAVEFAEGKALSIAEVNSSNLKQALDLVNRVFYEFVAVDYSEKGKKTFDDYIKSKYDELYADINTGRKKIWACHQCGEIVGVIAVRDISHIALMFVDKHHHRKGVAKYMLNYVLADIEKTSGITHVTVNSSPYAVNAYERLGFEKTDEQQEKDGLLFTPMIKYLVK